MYVCDGDAAQPAKDVSTDIELLTHAMEYMSGEFTERDDRMYLVDASVALFYMMNQRHKDGILDDTAVQLLEKAKDRRDELFPRELFDNMMEMVEEVVESGCARFHAKSASKTFLRAASGRNSFSATKADSFCKHQTGHLGAKSHPVPTSLIV
jgi:hypothetical protein